VKIGRSAGASRLLKERKLVQEAKKFSSYSPRPASRQLRGGAVGRRASVLGHRDAGGSRLTAGKRGPKGTSMRWKWLKTLGVDWIRYPSRRAMHKKMKKRFTLGVNIETARGGG